MGIIAPAMSKVFISYDRANMPIVATLVEDIGNLGHLVWFDQELRGGRVWWDLPRRSTSSDMSASRVSGRGHLLPAGVS
jgi:hypothetical protein